MTLTPAEITSVEACATELEDVAHELRRAHTRADAPDNWTDEEAAKADYDYLMKLAGDARAMVRRDEG